MARALNVVHRPLSFAKARRTSPSLAGLYVMMMDMVLSGPASAAGAVVTAVAADVWGATHRLAAGAGSLRSACRASSRCAAPVMSLQTSSRGVDRLVCHWVINWATDSSRWYSAFVALTACSMAEARSALACSACCCNRSDSMRWSMMPWTASRMDLMLVVLFNHLSCMGIAKGWTSSFLTASSSAMAA